MDRQQTQKYLMTQPSQLVRDTWIQYEKLLKEAVINNHYHGLHKLLVECESSIEHVDDFKEVCYLPLTIAIAKQNVPMMNLFRKHGYKLKRPRDTEHDCDGDGLEDSYDDAKKQVYRIHENLFRVSQD